jgi:hypothetical protein
MCLDTAHIGRLRDVNHQGVGMSLIVEVDSLGCDGGTRERHFS